MNQVTAFIDGSQIYGSTETLAWELRLKVNGSLNTSGHNFLPPENTASISLYNECVNGSGSEHCFKAGISISTMLHNGGKGGGGEVEMGHPHKINFKTFFVIILACIYSCICSI